ncbi:MAG: LysM peptidoglycan-binding domain-containing protein [Odoribacter sp.]|nr:LysM peptidoglycan-binding domain-containing protein [Odoribacter sp.]
MNNYLRQITVALASVGLAISASALDLPVKTINGEEYYYYAVKRGDTVLSIARELGVTRDDIVTYNRSAADGLRQGSTIYLPVDEFKDVISPKSESSMPVAAKTDVQTYYKVKRGETLFGISHRFGLTPEAIIALNPTAERGVKAGETLRIPAGAHALVEQEVQSGIAGNLTEQPDMNEPEISQVSENKVPPMPSDDTIDRTLREVPGPVALSEEESTDTVRPDVAVILPLMLDGDPQAKQARQATEFIKGFMLGLKSVKSEAWPMNLYIYDNAGSIDTISTILSRPECADLSLVISPDSQAATSATLSALGDRDTYMLNLLAVQDTSYLTDSRMMQFNVPHDIMYAKAAEALLMQFDGFTPVFLISKGGRSEKIAFTDYVRQLYSESGVEPLEIVFEGMLSQRELENLDPDGHYVFIPSSGSLTEFNKFARALISLKQSMADPSQVGVFGYPDWIIFRNDALESLHSLGAVIYSRFYDDSTSPQIRAFAAEFEAEYGTPMLEQEPSQALLGYDTARYLVANLMAGQGNFDPEWPEPFTGLQSTFLFRDAESAYDVDGIANLAVYIINYLAGDEVQVQVL